MGRLVGVRQQLDWTWFDTAVKANGPCDVDARTMLFGARNIGNRNLTNMEAPGHLPSEKTFVILSTPTLVQFENEKLYGVVARDAKVTLVVQDKLERGGSAPLPLGLVRGDRPEGLTFQSSEEFDKLCDAIHHLAGSVQSNDQYTRIQRAMAMFMPGGLAIPVYLPPRQSFEVTFELFDGAEKIIGESGGAKSIVHCLRGILTRDVM